MPPALFMVCTSYLFGRPLLRCVETTGALILFLEPCELKDVIWLPAYSPVSFTVRKNLKKVVPKRSKPPSGTCFFHSYPGVLRPPARAFVFDMSLLSQSFTTKNRSCRKWREFQFLITTAAFIVFHGTNFEWLTNLKRTRDSHKSARLWDELS